MNRLARPLSLLRPLPLVRRTRIVPRKERTPPTVTHERVHRLGGPDWPLFLRRLLLLPRVLLLLLLRPLLLRRLFPQLRLLR